MLHCTFEWRTIECLHPSLEFLFWMATVVCLTLLSVNGVLIGQANNFHRRWMFNIPVSIFNIQFMCVVVTIFRDFLSIRYFINSYLHLSLGRML